MDMNSRAIIRFGGAYRFLSNFHPSPIVVWGMKYPTAEHAYQSAKSPTFWGVVRFSLMTYDKTPGQVKRLGQKITLRPEWKYMKLLVMAHIVQIKFEIPELRAQLLATKDYELVEGNDWGDKFWGECDGEGENNLGKILMVERALIRSSQSESDAN